MTFSLANRHRVRSTRTRLALERLEDRTLPTISLSPTAWTPIGPAPIDDPTGANEPATGRITAIAADPGNANIIYIGSAGGGVWKTQNGGATWLPMTDDQASLVIGSLALAPSDPRVIYAGTGEANNSGDSFYGRGILKSTNAGTTWTLLPGFQDDTHPDVFDRRVVSRIVVDPSHPDIVYAAVAQGGSVLQGGNVVQLPGAVNGLVGNAGVWKSTDGGQHWTNTTTAIPNQFLAADGTSNEGFTDLVIDPSNANILYTAIGTLNGSAACGVYVTTTAGDVPAGGGSAWAAAGNFPMGLNDGRISLAIAPSEPQTVYAAITNPGTPPPNTAGAIQGTLRQMLLTTNGGSTANWTPLVNTPEYMNSFGYYANALAVNPTDASNVFAAGGVNGLIETTDGGATWTNIAQSAANGPHVDHHALAFDKNNHLLDGNDGGIWLLSDSSVDGPSWTDINGDLQITTFNTVAPDPNDPNKVFGASQDNGLSFFVNFPLFSITSWSAQVQGDGGFVRADPFQQGVFYFAPSTANAPIFQVTSDEGATWSADTGTGTQSINVDGNGFLMDNAHFYPPFTLDQNTAGRILFASDRIYETRDRGNTWRAISTTNTGNWDTAAPIDSVAIAPTDSNTVYATAGGEIFVTTDDGATWTKRTIGGATDHFGQLVVDPDNSRFVFAVRDQFDDPGNHNVGHVFRSGDGGATWQDISGDLPDVPVNCLVMDPQDRTIYVGTDEGVFLTLDNSNLWNVYPDPSTGSLPNVRVTDLQLDAVHHVLAAATYGRGAWEIQKFPNLQVGVIDQHGTEGLAPNGQPLVATFEDPTGPDFLTILLHSATIDWGDNSTSHGLILPDSTFDNQFDVYAAHTYAEDGVYPITVTVSDPDGSTGSASGRATIADAALSATGIASAQGVEGASFTMQLASFTDADPTGTLTDYSATIDWGDHTSGSATIAAGTGGYTVSGTHAYVEEGSYQVRITITDTGGATASVTVPCTVADAALVGTAIPVAATEGMLFGADLASFGDFDPAAEIGRPGNPYGNEGDYSATIDWGDNSDPSTGAISIDQENGVYLVNAGHAYVEEGTYHPHIKIHDVGGASTVVTGNVTVQDAPLHAFPRTASVAKGQPFSGTLLSFTDDDPNAQFSILFEFGNTRDYSAQIDWGDGSTSAGTVGQNFTTFLYEVAGTHTYAPGVWSPSVTVFDVGGSRVTADATITVGQLTTLGLTSSLNPSRIGQPVTLTATVTPVNAAAGVPIGPVTFMTGSTMLGSARLQVLGGLDQASITVTSLPAGYQSLTAFYDGDTVFDGSENLLRPLRQFVQAPPEIRSLAILSGDPDLAVTPRSLLSATVVGDDPDGDPIHYLYQWSHNGIDLPAATSSTLDLGLLAGIAAGDTIAVRVTPVDANDTGLAIVSSVIVSAGLGDLIWARQFGSHGSDGAYAVSADASGEYVAGHTDGTVSGGDMYLVKYDPAGNVLWTRQFGTATSDSATAVFAYGSGAYVAGSTKDTSAHPVNEAFVARYDAAGSLIWSRQFRFNAFSWAAEAVSADSTGVYVAGQAADFAGSAFLIKYDPNGTLLWVRRFGAAARDTAHAVYADGTAVYVAGNARDGLNGQTALGSDDAFLAKYDPAGNLLWTRQFGSADLDMATGVTANSTGVYVTGWVGGAMAGQTSAGSFDAFLVKYDAAGNALWAHQFGTADSDAATAVATDGSALYVSGTTSGALPGQTAMHSADAFVVKYDNSGELLGTRQFGTFLPDTAYSTAVAGTAVYVAGSTDGDLPGALRSGSIDSFLVKFATSGNNVPPVIASLTISSSGPAGLISGTSVLTANVVGYDPDGETVSYAYQWTKNGVLIEGVTGAVLDLSPHGGAAPGDTITVTVTPSDPTAPGTPISASVVASVVADPADQTIDVGQTTTFVSAYADPGATVQWQSSTDGGGTYQNVRGATRNTLAIAKATLRMDGMLLRAAFATTAGTIYSDGAVLHVNALPTIGNPSVVKGTVGDAYQATLTIAGGTAPFALSAVSGLPAGLSAPSIIDRTLPPTKGAISTLAFVINLAGTPTTAGTFRGSITLTDAAGARVVKTFTITIAASSVKAPALVALTNDGHLLTFAPTTPDRIAKTVAITGLAKGDVLHTLVSTPQGKLYGIAGSPGSFEVEFDRIYRIDPVTGAATQPVQLPPFRFFSVDGVLAASFDPVHAWLRLIDDTGHNDLVDPSTGTVKQQGVMPLFASGNPCFFQAIAYTNEVVGATSAILYGIATMPALVTLGDPSPNAGLAHTVAPSQAFATFTITASNTAYAIGRDSSKEDTALWTVNLTTAVATRVGHFGTGATIFSLAALPGGAR
jgi:hypothetical protein